MAQPCWVVGYSCSVVFQGLGLNCSDGSGTLLSSNSEIRTYIVIACGVAA